MLLTSDSCERREIARGDVGISTVDSFIPSHNGNSDSKRIKSRMSFFAGQPAWLCSFQSDPKRLPGVITSTQRLRMATVAHPGKHQRLHADQLRPHTPEQLRAEPIDTFPSAHQATKKTQQPTPQATQDHEADGLPQLDLCWSTRIRRPLWHLNL